MPVLRSGGAVQPIATPTVLSKKKKSNTAAATADTSVSNMIENIEVVPATQPLPSPQPLFNSAAANEPSDGAAIPAAGRRKLRDTAERRSLSAGGKASKDSLARAEATVAAARRDGQILGEFSLAPTNAAKPAAAAGTKPRSDPTSEQHHQATTALLDGTAAGANVANATANNNNNAESTDSRRNGRSHSSNGRRQSVAAPVAAAAAASGRPGASDSSNNNTNQSSSAAPVQINGDQSRSRSRSGRRQPAAAAPAAVPMGANNITANAGNQRPPAPMPASINSNSHAAGNDGRRPPLAAAAAVPANTVTLAPRTATISAEQAAERGCVYVDDGLSVVMHVKATAANGKPWLDAGTSLFSTDSATQTAHVANYLSTLVTVPFIPKALLAPDADITQQMTLLSNSELPTLARWASTIGNNFNDLISVTDAETCPRAPVNPVPAVEDMAATFSARCPRAMSWAELLTVPSAALVGPAGPAKGSDSLPILMRFPNRMVRNLAVAHIHAYRALQHLTELQTIFAESKLARQHLESDGSQWVSYTVASGSKQATSTQLALQRLRRPAVPSMDSPAAARTSAVCRDYTPMPSTVFTLQITMENYRPRWVTFRIDGLPSAPYPYMGQSKNGQILAPPTNEEAATRTLDNFFRWHSRLRTPVTSIKTPPSSQSRNRSKSVMFLTTLTSNVSLVYRTMSYWRSQTGTASRWITGSITISKPLKGIAWCDQCQEPEHYRSQCPELKNLVDGAARPTARCDRCNQPDIAGHPCKTVSELTCRLCNQPQHTGMVCQLRQRSWAQLVSGVTSNKAPAPSAPQPLASSPVQQQTAAQALPLAAIASQPLPSLNFAKQVEDAISDMRAQMAAQIAQIAAFMQQMQAERQLQMAQFQAMMSTIMQAQAHSVAPMTVPASQIRLAPQALPSLPQQSPLPQFSPLSSHQPSPIVPPTRMPPSSPAPPPQASMQTLSAEEAQHFMSWIATLLPRTTAHSNTTSLIPIHG